MAIDIITNATKVKYWIERINEIINRINATNYSWDILSEKGQLEYNFPTSKYKTMPSGGDYVVYYSGVELHPDDYNVNTNILKFTNAPEESGCLIRVRYLRDGRDKV